MLKVKSTFKLFTVKIFYKTLIFLVNVGILKDIFEIINLGEKNGKD